MLVKFKYNTSDENDYSIFVNSYKLNNMYEYECPDSMQETKIRVVQKNLLNCSKIKLITILKIFSSFFLYGENEYYAPYYVVSECLIIPSKSPLIYIEQKNRKIVFKNEKGEEIESQNCYEITKKNMVKYVVVCILRALLIALLLVFGWRYLFNVTYLKDSIMPYFLSLILVLYTIYSLFDMFSTLFRSILLLSQMKHKDKVNKIKTRDGYMSCKKTNNKEKGR